MTKSTNNKKQLIKKLIELKPNYTKEFLRCATEEELIMLMRDRKGKRHDPEFVKFLYDKFNLGVDEVTGKKKRRKRKST